MTTELIDTSPIETDHSDTDLIDATTAASLLRVSTRTLERFRREGLIGWRRIGGRCFFTPADVEAFLASAYVPPHDFSPVAVG